MIVFLLAPTDLVNENVIKPAVNAMPNVSFPDMTSERHRYNPIQFKPVVLRPANKSACIRAIRVLLVSFCVL
jgi:hypothetical protein